MTIYALGGRRAIPVETVPADRRGRFRYRYRFRSIAGPTRFSFRAVVKRQPNYPYARGTSRNGERPGAGPRPETVSAPAAMSTDELLDHARWRP